MGLAMALNICVTTIFMVILLGCIGVVIPDSIGKKDRVVTDKPLSDADHYDNEEHHNTEYDHEAFLGDQAKTFDQLTPEESKERLSKIVDKIDVDGDKSVTTEELKNWIHKTQSRYIQEDVEKQWVSHAPENPDKVSWAEYRKLTYGFDSDEEADKDVGSEDGSYNYRDMMKRDKRRWDTADQDKDGLLTKEEFGNFLHPEEAEHMKHIVVTETVEDIDKDKDGQISLLEYIVIFPNVGYNLKHVVSFTSQVLLGDMYQGNDEAEPDWVKTEREQFVTYRDTNKDGVMDRDEVQAWILPHNFDNSLSEANHLIESSDENKDGKLSKEEILEKYELFVGSQATDFGEALTHHEEL
ncbi:Calumenin-B [Nymphon striatum]|nr:Calumenin-B [Nymphon striatum]